MLSYQHSYHAGSMADVHKHAALAWVLDYLIQKPKPLSYIETHAGRGLYDLDSAEARKTAEARAGILRAAALLSAAHPYLRLQARVRTDHGASAYAGSPLLAALALRPGDRIDLAELHPGERAALVRAMHGTGATVHARDGFALARALTPPTPRRGVMLIDPSYEIKTEFRTIPGQIAHLHRKWNVGVIMLWYPLLARGAHRPMQAALDALAVPGALHHELSFPPARPGHGMTGSGLYVINPPFGLRDALGALSLQLG